MSQSKVLPGYEKPYRSQVVSSDFLELLEHLVKLAKGGIDSKVGAHKLLVSDVEALVSDFISEQEHAVKLRNSERQTEYLENALGELSQEECMKIPSIQKKVLARLAWSLDPISGKLPLSSLSGVGHLIPSYLPPELIDPECSG